MMKNRCQNQEPRLPREVAFELQKAFRKPSQSLHKAFTGRVSPTAAYHGKATNKECRLILSYIEIIPLYGCNLGLKHTH
jgi:hypothetical protein